MAGSDDLLAQALSGMDEVLAKRPDKDDHALTAVTKALCEHRDALTDRSRAGGLDAAGRDRLERLNGVIALVLALHFPQGAAPWDGFAQARGWLSDLQPAPEPAA